MHNFYSDTQTKPTRAMLETVLDAEVGDEQRGADPTTSALCARVAELLGQEAAVFLPSGTMCNEIAVRIHCNPGDEILCDRTSHIVNFEGGGPAALSGAMIRALDGERGIFSADQVAAAVRSGSRYEPPSRLLSVEQTANMGGGAVWPLAAVESVVAVARENGLALHMDGARLMNAVVASGVPADRITAGFDSCWLDFTKGLGAPVGAVLAGSEEFIHKAWRFKQQWGGAMRQSGVIAAMCLYALDHNVERLADDNALAASIAEQLQQLDLVEGVLPADSNIVIFDLAPDGPDAATLVGLVREDGIAIGALDRRRVRIVTHLDVGQAAGRALMDSLTKHLSRSGATP